MAHPCTWHPHLVVVHGHGITIDRPKSYIMPAEVEKWLMKLAGKIIDGEASDKAAGWARRGGGHTYHQ